MPATPSGVVAPDSASITPTTKTTTKPRGGMCARPFGGFDRLDRIDLFAFASGTDSPFKLLYLKVIQQALAEYLYFGLGRNGTTPAEFYFASRYFFAVRSRDPETWGHSRVINEIVADEVTGKRNRRIIHLSHEEFKLGCFDTHYALAELDKVMPFDKFVRYLEDQRLEVLAQNWNQVCSYLNIADADEHKTLRELVRPSTIPVRRHRAIISLPVNQQASHASNVGPNSASIGAMERAA